LVLFAELKVEPHLFYLVFGESVMNDAVGLVLFETSRKFITVPDVGTFAFLKAAAKFFYLLFGSLLMGILVSLVMAAIIKRSELRTNPVLEQVSGERWSGDDAFKGLERRENADETHFFFSYFWGCGMLLLLPRVWLFSSSTSLFWWGRPVT
jgi:hypothetical protein